MKKPIQSYTLVNAIVNAITEIQWLLASAESAARHGRVSTARKKLDEAALGLVNMAVRPRPAATGKDATTVMVSFEYYDGGTFLEFVSATPQQVKAIKAQIRRLEGVEIRDIYVGLPGAPVPFTELWAKLESIRPNA